MPATSKSVLPFTLAPLFEFLFSFFIPKQKKLGTDTEQQQPFLIAGGFQSSPSHQQQRISKNLSMSSTTSSESIRIFTLALQKYIHTISGAAASPLPVANIDTEMIDNLQRLKNALSDHKNVLKGLTALYHRETYAAKCLPLSQSLKRGVQTNTVIVKFIWDCCHDGHPRGLLEHRMKTAFFSDRIVRATDEQLSVIYAYKVANGGALLLQ